ncbi:MAG: formyltetrahydrofolate deformylase, partial [Verrucomicrobiota bacterium]
RRVVANHDTLRPIAEAAGHPFEVLPVRKESKAADFERYRQMFEETEAELIILARFMQIFPESICKEYRERMINIHHSFLPAFAGAKPYHQAFERGVKIIGATSHYVTSDLDAGPIIEQEVRRIDHHHRPADLRRLGKDCECLALSRGVRYHATDRVLVHGNKTIVFRF